MADRQQGNAKKVRTFKAHRKCRVNLAGTRKYKIVKVKSNKKMEIIAETSSSSANNINSNDADDFYDEDDDGYYVDDENKLKGACEKEVEDIGGKIIKEKLKKKHISYREKIKKTTDNWSLLSERALAMNLQNSSFSSIKASITTEDNGDTMVAKCSLCEHLFPINEIVQCCDCFFKCFCISCFELFHKNSLHAGRIWDIKVRTMFYFTFFFLYTFFYKNNLIRTMRLALKMGKN